MARDRRGVKSIFDEAAEIASPEDRAAYVNRACGGDADLRKRSTSCSWPWNKPVASWKQPPPSTRGISPITQSNTLGLKAIPRGCDGPRRRLSARIRDATRRWRAQAPSRAGAHRQLSSRIHRGSLIGSLIAGRYKLREEIGEGGWDGLPRGADPSGEAEGGAQADPGRDGFQAVLARFESERQALALMDHPNIARVFDAGTAEPGRPFFVMELVKGIPLTTYSDEHRLDLPARLTLSARSVRRCSTRTRRGSSTAT